MQDIIIATYQVQSSSKYITTSSHLFQLTQYVVTLFEFTNADDNFMTSTFSYALSGKLLLCKCHHLLITQLCK